MSRKALLKLLEPYGLLSRGEYHAAAFARNVGLLDANEVDALMRARVGIPGMGGVGGSHFVSLSRAGVGAFHVADMDRFNPVNVNRQYGATASRFNQEKMQSMVDIAMDINPFATIRSFPEGVTPENVDAFLEGVDVVLDGLDFFVFDVRRMLFKHAYDKGIPVITAGPMGFGAAMLVFMPGGMGFDEYFDITDSTPRREKLLKFAMGLAPAAIHAGYIDLNTVSLSAKRGPSSGLACQICSSLATMEAVRILLGRKGGKPVPNYLQFDAYRRKLVRGKLRKGNRGLLPRLKLWAFTKFLLKSRTPDPVPLSPPPPDAGNDAIHDYIITAGLQAPSGDNVQPWKFRKGGSSIDVFMDRKADLSFFNVKQAASLIATGAVLENMNIAARACARDVDIELLPDGPQNGHAARLTLTPRPGTHEDDAFLDAIWLRNTNRKSYSQKPVKNGVWETISETLPSLPGLRLQWINDRKSIKTFSKAVMLADIIRSENRSLHEHLVSMIRYTRQEAEETRDGLPLKNLEAGAPGEVFLKATRSWNAMRVANVFQMGKAVAGHSAAGIVRSGGVGYLSVSGMEAKDFLLAGRGLQRIWLRFAHFGLQFQPSAAPALFRLRQLMRGDESFGSGRHVDLLIKAWPMIEDVFPGFLSGIPVMFFRVGFAPNIRYGTYRRPLESFLMSE